MVLSIFMLVGKAISIGLAPTASSWANIEPFHRMLSVAEVEAIAGDSESTMSGY